MVETTIFKGYRNGKEVWAIRKVYGSNDTATDFVCEIEPTLEIIAEYRKQKNVFDNTRKSQRQQNWDNDSQKKTQSSNL